MGFISSNKIEAYLTQKGRELFINGQKKDSIVKYFVLGDSDKNYFNNKNDFDVCDLSGDNSLCIKSLSNSVKLKYSVNQLPLINPNLKFITDGNLTSKTNDKEIISIGISDNTPRNTNIGFKLNITLISKSEWFNKLTYKGVEYTNVNDIGNLTFTILAGDLKTSNIEIFFNQIPFAQPFSLIQSLQMVLQLTNFSGAVMGSNDVITIVKTQDSYAKLELSTSNLLVSCNSTNDGKITATAIGGSGVYVYYLKNLATNIEINNTTGVFNNLTVNTYIVKVIDSVGFTESKIIIITKVKDFIISNIITTNCNDSDGKLKITLSNLEGMVQYRLFSYPENILLQETPMITTNVYEFNIPLTYLDLDINTPTEYQKQKDFKIEVYSQYCGLKSESGNIIVRDIKPLYVQDVIRCQQIVSGNRTNSNRVNSKKDINLNSLTYDQNKLDNKGNVEWLFYDVDVLACPLPISGNMSFQPTINKYNTIDIGVTYTNSSNNIITLTDKTILNNNIYLGKSGVITVNMAHITTFNLTILEDNVNIYSNNITNMLTYTFTASPNKFYKILITEDLT